MLLTPHTAAAVAIASILPQPELAIPLSFFSHFVLDFIPHWDRIGLGMLEEKFRPVTPGSPQFTIIFLDALLALAYALFFAWRVMPDYGWAATMLLSAFAANLPDMFYIPRAFFGKTWGFVMWVIKLQNFIQQKSKAALLPGLLTQAATVAVCWLAALR